jgi:hypothetical protein
MAAPSNPLKALVQNISSGVDDVRTGWGQIQRGQIADGVWNLAAGSSNVGGFGTAAFTGIKGESLAKKTASDAENATAAVEDQARVDLAQSQIDKRKDTIRRRIDAEIALRLRRPGRSQTLLTPGQTSLVANPTLLTGGRENG